MTHEEYLSQLEKKIRILNRIIDHKILIGEKYVKEARDHRIILEKIWQHKFRSQKVQSGSIKSTMFNRFFSASSFQH